MKKIEQFRRHLQRLGYGKTSVQMLPSCVADFLKYTSKFIQNITSQDILNYKTYLEQRPKRTGPGGLSESYIHHHIYGLKLFFAWQQSRGVLLINPMSSLSFKSPKSKKREILSVVQIKELYGLADVKERVVLSLFYGCGLRRSEGEQLNLKDVSFKSGLLYVRKGKGGKRRVVPMSEKVIEDLQMYVDSERKWTIKSDALVHNIRGRRMSGDSYNRILKSLLKRTELKGQITLHSLRHSIASHLLERGLSVEYVRDFIGHKHLESTQIYTHIKSDQIWNWKST
jgi:integrase/recombinase XerD